MRLRTYLLAFLTLLATMGTMAANKFTLVIDAGHGGKDTGAPGKISVEKIVNRRLVVLHLYSSRFLHFVKYSGCF